MNESSAHALWVKAGGGTPDFDRGEYRRLMAEHGPLTPGEQAQPLPCGWPVAPRQTWETWETWEACEGCEGTGGDMVNGEWVDCSRCGGEEGWLR